MRNKTFLAIVPARKGSKRLPNKNIKELNNKPLIAYTIEASLKCKYITKTVVSTDCENIKRISLNYGAEVPFLRPNELSLDETKSIDVITHVINNLEEQYDYIILLQPTSPLRDYLEIEKAINLLNEKNADAIISVCETEHNPIWSNTLDHTKNMENFLDKKFINSRSQDLNKFYRLNGAIYICKTDILKKQNTLFIDKNIFAYEMPQEKSVDIDTKLDFIIAEAILNNYEF